MSFRPGLVPPRLLLALQELLHLPRPVRSLPSLLPEPLVHTGESETLNIKYPPKLKIYAYSKYFLCCRMNIKKG